MKRGPKPKMKCLLPLDSIAACHPTCKCAECRKVRKARHEKTLARHQARVRAGEIEVIHGSLSAYSTGCRCTECRAASADYRRMLYAHARGKAMTEILNCPRCGSKVGCSTSGYFCISCDWREDGTTMTMKAYVPPCTCRKPCPQHGSSVSAAAFLAGYCTDREGEATVETIDKVKAEFEAWLESVHPPQEGPGQ